MQALGLAAIVCFASVAGHAESQQAPAIGETVSEIHKSCWAIFQDKDGSHWFGSDGMGVSRYDGKTITRFTTRDGLVHDQVRRIYQHGPTGDILITTNGGVSKFDGERFTTLPTAKMIAPTLTLTDESLKSAGWTLNGTDTWLGGSGGPLRYDGKTLIQLKFPKSPLEEELTAKIPHREDWSPYDVWHVYKDRKGHVWFGTGMFGICRFDGKSLDWMFERHLTEVEGGGWFGFRSIIEDKEGTFWICNTQFGFDVQPHGVAGQQVGLIKYQRKVGMDLSAIDTTDKYIYFQSVTQDKNGDLWMAPWAGGVWKYDGKKVTHYPMTHVDEHIKMISFYTDNRGDIWVAGQEHGPYKFNGTSFEAFAPRVEQTANAESHKPRPPSDPYFIPTEGKITATMPRVIIRNMRQDRAGNIWFASYGGPIRYDGKNFRNFQDEVGLSNTRIFSLLEDRAGALWFGTITGGASRYDGNTFTKFTTKDGLAGNDVHWIFEDRDGSIWLGTLNGVSRYDGKSFTKFTTKDGLLDNAVYTIGQDAAGRIWFGTQGGICSYDGRTFANIALQVGRTFTNIRAMAVDKSGILWFGGQGGAYRIDDKALTTFTSKEGLLDDFVGSMIVDRAGNVWMGHPGHGTSRGGASRYDGKSFTHFTEKDGLNSGNVYAMLEDSAGNIWFGSVDAGACRYDGKTFTNFSAINPPRLPEQ
jgi:ligand-binding sensor domain-containing protein